MPFHPPKLKTFVHQLTKILNFKQCIAYFINLPLGILTMRGDEICMHVERPLRFIFNKFKGMLGNSEQGVTNVLVIYTCAAVKCVVAITKFIQINALYTMHAHPFVTSE